MIYTEFVLLVLAASVRLIAFGRPLAYSGFP